MCGTKPTDRQILPQNVRPTNYKVTLEPDLEKYTFKGSVGIDLDVKQESKSISVNVLDLKIHSASVAGQEPKEITYDKDAQSATFHFNQDFAEGSKVTLDIDFTGELNDKLCGFYRSVHKDENGKERVVATTQMEPTDCRRAFPCFDEPSLKATFDITLVAPKELTALSNMDVKEEKILESGKKATSFNRSPVMSTYLVAFIVGELSYVESNYFRVPVRVYATPGMEERCKFSAELGARTLEFFEKKFDVPYPLPKMDMVGIHDFSAGAMENWGLVTYRVVDLLFDEQSDGASTKQRVAEVVQHELAHQWFGNLVTMEWWDGLWLNEGFATWMSWYSCNAFYPDWKVWETYVGDNLQSSLALDGLRSSHPVQVPVQRADEINQIFDAISYSKGSSIVKMVSKYLGEETFIKGISLYLKRHAYGNTKTEDLWNALSEVSGKDVVSVMDVWTRKVGYPVVSVTEKDAHNITVKQNRFLTTGDVKPEEDTTLYPLTLGLKTSKGVEDIVMTEREMELKVAEDDFYKLNAEQSGIYRVLYPTERVKKLSAAGVEGKLSVEDRVGLVADSAALSTSGYQKTSDLLTLISQWKSEKESNVWSEMLSRLGVIRSTWKFESEEVKEALKKFERSLAVPMAKQLGYTFASEEPLLQKQLKARVFSSAVKTEDPEFVKVADELFAKYIGGDSKAIDPNLRGAVFGRAGESANEETFEKLVAIYKSPKASAEGLAAIQSLARNKNVELKKKALKYALDGTVRSQDIFYVLQGCAVDPEGVEILWEWFSERWDDILASYPPSLGMLSSIILISSGGFNTQAQLDTFTKFFASKDTRGYDKAIGISTDRIQSRISWLQRDRENVKQWLSANGYL
ncbi:alanine/arginine aminopeptidase [Trichomonascus vanleenenianus]|uniref:M1 family metallopeptidase n=1 Tax=Trichomonascus vanleenenianus TaxID=2268995 RepID=UPI003ECAB0EA